jgi:hypothetical protein
MQKLHEPCTLEDLQALVPYRDRFDVRANDELDVTDGGTSDIEESECQNCHEYFTPDSKHDLESLAEAWQRALAHFGAEVAA